MGQFDDLFDDLVPVGAVDFTLDRVFVRCDKPLVLRMQHAGDANPRYKSARLKLTKELESHSKSGDKDALWGLIIRLLAKTVVTDWKNCNGKDGQPLAYTPELGAELLTQIYAKASDEIAAAYQFASNADNFRGSPIAAADALGK